MRIEIDEVIKGVWSWNVLAGHIWIRGGYAFSKKEARTAARL